MSDDLRVDDELTIPASELVWRFETTGGPGGQHANRSATRAVLSFDLGSSVAITDDVRAQLLRRLGGRARNGVLTFAVDESRSQWRNRQLARRRLAEALREARRPRRRRVPTKPPRSAVLKRLESKRRRGEIKRLRRRPD